MVTLSEQTSDGTPLITDEALATVRDQQLEKLDATYEHFGVPSESPDAKDQLLLAVLETFVPGWQSFAGEEAAKRGRKATWKNGQDVELFHAVKKLLDAGTHDLDAALRKLKHDQKLIPAISTLRKHYYTGSAKYVRSKIAAQKFPEFARFLGIEPPL
jgi:hypothetical protein